jgi:hypothetical protein
MLPLLTKLMNKLWYTSKFTVISLSSNTYLNPFFTNLIYYFIILT